MDKVDKVDVKFTHRNKPRKITMNEKEITAELEAAKAATDRSAIVEFGRSNYPSFDSVYYKVDSGESTVVRFKCSHTALQFCQWIDAYFAD